MKSKVILFSVLLFCSKIVDSISHPEDHVRQRVNPLSNWQANQNAPNAQYPDTDFTQTRNTNIQQGKTQDYYPNQGRHNYDSNGYNRSPASSQSGEDLLVSYDSPADGRRLDSYPSRVESYPPRTSQVGFDNQQYQNQNWRSQNQYPNSAPSTVLIPDVKRPLVTTVQEPYRAPVKYLQTKYVPSSNRRFYQPGRSYLTREQFQYPLTGDSKYVANSAPRFGSGDPVPYENYSEDQVAASEIKPRSPGGRRYVQSFVPQSGIIFNEDPVVIATDTLTDQSDNIGYAENYRSGSDLSNTASITNYDDRSPMISEADNNSDSIPSNLAHVNTKKEAPVVVRKILSEKPLTRRYANNYRPDSGTSNIARDDSFNGAPVVTEAVEVESGEYEANYESDYRPKEPVPINTYLGAPSTPSDTVLVNSESNKHEESNVAHHGSSSPTPTNTNPKQNVYHTISSGITEFNLKGLVTNPEIQNILAGTNKRYVIVHSNGTIEYMDKIDLNSHQNSKLRLVHTKRKNIGDSNSDGVFTQQSPENLPNNIAETPVLVDEYPLPTNNQSADDKKPTPLYVDQANPADENDSKLSPPLKDLPENHSNLKPLPQPEKQPAVNNNSKLLPSYLISPADDDNSTPSTPNEDQSAQNDNLKPLPQDVNQPRDDDNSKLLTPHVNQSASDGISKSLPQDRNQPADQKNKPADDDNLKLLILKEDQPAHDDNSKLEQPKDGNNSTSLFPNARQPAHVKKPKQAYVKHPEDNKNSKPLPMNENQALDDKPFHPYRRQPAHHNKSKHPHVNKPADNNNSNPSSPGENSRPTNEDQSGGKTDSTSLHPHKRQPGHRYKSKPKHSHDQPADDNNPNPSSTSLLKYPENQPDGDNNSNSSSPGEDQTGDDNTSKPLPSNENHSGDDNDSKPLPAHATQSANNTKSKPSHGDQAGDDNNSNTSSPDENQAEEDKKSKPTSAVASKNYDQSNSTTAYPTVPSYTTSSKHNHRKSTTNSPDVSTTPCPDDTSEDQIITLSPIEQTTDNVSDVPPVATTTTTTRTFETPGKSDIINDANNKDKDDIAQTYSTTTVSPSTSTLPTDNISDDKTIETKENKNTQTKDTTVVDQVNNRKKDTQTAVYNSSELFDTNTEVPAKSDDYSSVTASPSVQNDVNTGDASGDNSLELKQSETDVTITVTTSTANDSEDEIITINVEISESTDNADSSSNDKSLVVSIDTNGGSDDDSKTPKPEDCKKDHNSNDGRGKNVEIDMSNLKGKPTMWIRTTNQDFVDKLTAKNETEFDLIYFFHIDSQPAIEKDKTTTIYCNGTVVTETTEITYENKDDPSPTIVKTTKIMQIEDYKADV